MKYIQDQSRNATGALVLDAGNLFVYRREFPPQKLDDPETLKKATARAELIAEIYGRLGAAGVAVGGSDLALGVQTLRGLAARHRLPLLSANLQDAAGRRIFPASRVVKVGGLTFGVLGLTGSHPVWRDVLGREKLKLADAGAAAKAEVKALKAQGAEIIIALAAVGHLEARKLATETPGLDLVFVSGTGRHMPTLEKQGTAWVTETTREGKYIGHLTLHLRGAKRPLEDFSERYVIAERIESMQKSLTSLEAQPAPAATPGRPDWKASRLERLRSSIERMEQQLHTANQRSPQGSFLVNVLTPCALTLPEDPAAAALITQKAQAAALQRTPGAK